MAEAFYLTAAKKRPETGLHKVLEKKKIEQIIKKILIIKENSGDNRKPRSGLLKSVYCPNY